MVGMGLEQIRLQVPEGIAIAAEEMETGQFVYWDKKRDQKSLELIAPTGVITSLKTSAQL